MRSRNGATLGLGALALVLGAAGGTGACASPVQPPPGAAGRTIYELQLCANCHGETGGGRSLGPPLRDLGRFWEAERLAEFLGDPRRFEAGDARLRELAEGHSGTMDPYDNLSLEERLRLARYLLEL